MDDLKEEQGSGFESNRSTEKQMITRERFILAHQFAQSIIEDPSLKIKYKKMAGKSRNAYNKAVSEFMLKK